jgi:SAM-dependent methyltransferase
METAAMNDRSDLSGPIRRGWNRAAASYSDGLGIHLEPVARHLSDCLTPCLVPPVLDLACGPGMVLSILVGTETAGVFCDFSWDMVRIARSRPGGFHGVVADQDRLPFSTGSFGTVASSMGTIFSADPAAQFPEIARILTSGGLYGFTAWGRPEECALGAVSSSVIGRWPYPYEGQMPSLESPYSAGRTDWLESVSARSGFVIDQVESGILAFRFPDRDAAARALLGTGRFSLLSVGAPEREAELFELAREAFIPHRDGPGGAVSLSNRYFVFLLRRI